MTRMNQGRSHDKRVRMYALESYQKYNNSRKAGPSNVGNRPGNKSESSDSFVGVESTPLIVDSLNSTGLPYYLKLFLVRDAEDPLINIYHHYKAVTRRLSTLSTTRPVLDSLANSGASFPPSASHASRTGCASDAGKIGIK